MLTMRRAKSHLGRFLDDWLPRAWQEFNIARHDRNMEPEFWLVPYFGDRNSIALDVGANTGLYALYMAKFFRLVVALEPNLDCLNKLRARCPKNVAVVFGAASNVASVTNLRYDRSNTGIGTIEPKNTLLQFTDTKVTSYAIPTFPLDSLKLSDVAFMKIDVEGHEIAVIDGAMKTINRERPALLIEAEDRHVSGSVHAIHALLSSAGYSGYFLEKRLLKAVNLGDATEMSAGRKNNFIFLHKEKEHVYRSRMSPKIALL